MGAVEAYYDKKSASYEAVRQSLVFRIYDAITWKYLEPYVPSSQNSVVLDAGGGNGRWAIPMAKKGCKVVLVDISEGMLNVARQKVEAEGLVDRIEIRKADIRNLDYSNETFDLVFSDHTLFLFDQPDQVLSELVRILKPHAPIVLSAQNRLVQTLAHLPDDPKENPEIIRKALEVLQKHEYDMLSQEPPIKIHSMTPDEFRSLLERNGLEVEKMLCKIATMPLRFMPTFFMKTDVPEKVVEDLVQLEFAFSERPDAIALGAHLQAIARKI
jgi:ubiquinone/menaquinone biosynthesis C-methylase UbiE